MTLVISILFFMAGLSLFVMTVIEKNDIRQMLDEIKNHYNL